MLCVAIRFKQQAIDLPTLQPGDRPASLSDHRPEGLHLVLVSCNAADDGGEVWVSRAGVHVEVGALRHITSFDLVLERALGPGETYERPLRTSRGRATLRLVHQRHEEG